MKTAQEIYDFIMTKRYGVPNMKSTLKSHAQVIVDSLMEDETVVLAWAGNYRDGDKGKLTSSGETGMCFAMTNKRIIWGKKKVIGSMTKAISIKNVNDVSLTKKLMFSHLAFDTYKDTFTCLIGGTNDTVQDLYNKISITIDALQTFDRE